MGKQNMKDVFFGLKLNEGQEQLKEAILDDNNQVIMVNATAGSGKTLIAVACARLLTAYSDYSEAVYIFPTVEEGALGYRPGNTAEKESDYLEPLFDALIKINEIPRQAISSDITKKNDTAWITARSCTFMRGVNLEKKVVIIDECQNLSVPLIKRIISRCHDDCKVIVLGCTAQTDIPVNRSGFKQLLEYLGTYDKVKTCELPVSYRGWLAQAIDKL